MASPPAPHEPLSDPVPGLRSRSRTRARARARVNGAIWFSGEQPPKRRNVPERRKDSANVEPTPEPVVKRRKRSAPCDTTEKEPQDPSQPAFTVQRPRQHDTSAPSTLDVLVARPRKHAITPARQPLVKNVSDTNISSLAEYQDMESQVNKRLYDETLVLQTKVSRLEGELREERSFTEMAQNRVKQDMLMDIMKEKELREKAETNASLMKRRLEKEIQNLKTKLTEATEKCRLERNHTLSAHASAEAFRLEAEHWQNVSTILETDIDELRAIEAEAALKRKDEMRGLPPAYGNLDDEDRFPPYSKHADGGSMEIAHLKRVVRRQFDDMVSKSLARVDRVTSVLYDLSFILENICQRLRAILDTAKSKQVSRMRPQSTGYLTQHMQAIAMTDDPHAALQVVASLKAIDQKLRAAEKRILPQGELIAAKTAATLLQSPKGAPYLAEKIAALLLDMLWRTVAACETQPASKRLTSCTAHAQLPVQFESVDEALTSALQLTFSKRCSLSSLQYYLLQLEELAIKFRTLRTVLISGQRDGIGNFAFFSKALLWLNEQVEKERELRANEEPGARHSESTMSGMSGIEEDDLDNGDAVSSRWEGSDTSSDGDDE